MNCFLISAVAALVLASCAFAEEEKKDKRGALGFGYNGYGASHPTFASGHVPAAPAVPAPAVNFVGAHGYGYTSGAPLAAYGHSPVAVAAPAFGYGQAFGGYGAGFPGYGAGLNGYGAGLNGYGAGLNGYGAGLNGYGAGLAGYGAGFRGYGVGPVSYGVGPVGYGTGWNAAGWNAYGNGLAGYGFPAYGGAVSGYSAIPAGLGVPAVAPVHAKAYQAVAIPAASPASTVHGSSKTKYW